MPIINVIQRGGSEIKLEADNSWSIMEVLRDNKVDGIDGACGGALACATCHVYLHPNWTEKVNNKGDEQTDEEEDTLDQAFDITEYSRLSCQIRMSDELDGIVVAVGGAKIDW